MTSVVYSSGVKAAQSHLQLEVRPIDPAPSGGTRVHEDPNTVVDEYSLWSIIAQSCTSESAHKGGPLAIKVH